MPKTIQLREHSKGSGTGGSLYVTDSDGSPSLLGVGRSDDGRWFVTYYGGPDDWWGRGYGFVFLVPATAFITLPFYAGEFRLINCPFQPPSILPISSSFVDSAMYFLLSRNFDSHKTISRMVRVSVF